ncbi:proline-rich proteoglycan 2-like [Bubalus kerabau]|uniref:proline-rich proteoglycan 2-like n=1 Tax=Bubalus carabanensis TaxID=3119969 RepID=UPI00244E842E|nr:proline-rich proteoglycan 2-like [Bubalus carabanensis]
MRRGPSQENHEGLGTARCASLRARGSPKGAGAVKVGAAQQGPARPTHLAVSHPEVKQAGGLQEPATLAPTAGDPGGGLPAPPRRPPRTANRTSGPRAPARPARGSRALPPHLPPPVLFRAADENAGARREGQEARFSTQVPVSGSRPRGLPPRLSPPSSGPSRLPPPRRARRSRAPRGVGARAQCRRPGGAQAPVPAPRTRRGAGTVRKRAPVLAASCLLPRSLSADLGWDRGQESLVGFVR